MAYSPNNEISGLYFFCFPFFLSLCCCFAFVSLYVEDAAGGACLSA